MKQVSPTFLSLEEMTKRFIGINSLRIKMWQWNTYHLLINLYLLQSRKAVFKKTNVKQNDKKTVIKTSFNQERRN